MNKEDVIKLIDGIPFYRYEYTDFLYEKLQKKDEIIKEAIDYMEQAIHSNSSTKLPSGKITDIGYCIVAFEDLLNILTKEVKIMNNWEEFGYESKEEYQDAYDDYIVHKQLEERAEESETN